MERSGFCVFCSDVAAGRPLEGACGSSQFGTGGGRGGLGEGVQEFSGADELGCGFAVVVVQEDDGTFGDAGGAASCSGGRRPVRCADGFWLRGTFGGAVGQPEADLREGEVGGQFGAGVPDRFAVAVAVAGQGYVVAERVTGRGVAHLHAQARLVESGEELRFGGGARDGLADGFAERLAGGLGAAGPFGLELLCAGGVLRCGAVACVQAAQAHLLLDAAAFGLGLVEVVVQAGIAQVASDQGGDDVDVVFRVADCDPPTAVGITFRGNVGGVEDALGDGVPLLVGESPVTGGGADRAVPDVLGGRAVACLLDPEVEGGGEPGEGDLRVGVGAGVAAGVGGEAVPGADEVGVGVLLAPAGAVQVDEQAVGAGTASDVGNHHSRLVTRSFAASSTRARSWVSVPSACSSSCGARVAAAVEDEGDLVDVVTDAGQRGA